MKKESRPGENKAEEAANSQRRWLSWLFILPLLAYSLYMLSGMLGIEARSFLSRDFLLPALALTALFLCLLLSK